MKTFIFLAALSLTLNASANQFETKSQDLSDKNYQAAISYPLLNDSSVPAYLAINTNLLSTLNTNGCDAKEAAASENGYDYNATAIVVALNSSYVGFEVSDDSYCGGAHPNYVTYNLTYDAKTGANVSMEEEIPQQNTEGSNVDWDQFDKYQLQLATIIYKYRNQANFGDAGCYENLGKKDYIDQIKQFYPTISGLAKNKMFILRISPPHVATPCGGSVRVSYKEIKPFLKKNSILHSWMK